jgi:hypothetical protein
VKVEGSIARPIAGSFLEHQSRRMEAKEKELVKAPMSRKISQSDTVGIHQ